MGCFGYIRPCCTSCPSSVSWFVLRANRLSFPMFAMCPKYPKHASSLRAPDDFQVIRWAACRSHGGVRQGLPTLTRDDRVLIMDCNADIIQLVHLFPFAIASDAGASPLARSAARPTRSSRPLSRPVDIAASCTHPTTPASHAVHIALLSRVLIFPARITPARCLPPSPPHRHPPTQSSTRRARPHHQRTQTQAHTYTYTDARRRCAWTPKWRSRPRRRSRRTQGTVRRASFSSSRTSCRTTTRVRRTRSPRRRRARGGGSSRRSAGRSSSSLSRARCSGWRSTYRRIPGTGITYGGWFLGTRMLGARAEGVLGGQEWGVIAVSAVSPQALCGQCGWMLMEIITHAARRSLLIFLVGAWARSWLPCCRHTQIVHARWDTRADGFFFCAFTNGFMT